VSNEAQQALASTSQRIEAINLSAPDAWSQLTALDAEMEPLQRRFGAIDPVTLIVRDEFVVVHLRLYRKMIAYQSLQLDTITAEERTTERINKMSGNLRQLQSRIKVYGDRLGADANRDFEVAWDKYRQKSKMLQEAFAEAQRNKDSPAAKAQQSAKNAEDAARLRAKVDALIAKHGKTIDGLGLSKEMLSSRIHLEYLGSSGPSMPLRDWLAQVMDKPGFQRAQAVQSKDGRYRGVTLKFEEKQSTGFLFDVDPPDLFMSHVVQGASTLPLVHPGDKSRATLLFIDMANAQQSK
jgi:hypothetical protein